jgi:predicted O-methyltransferase YrrM
LDLVKAGFVREFVRGVDVKSVDLLFVDGDHDYNATLNDLKSWSRFVRSGGIISGHDIFNPVNDGVTDAVEDLLRGKNTIVRFATDHVYWWYS